MKNIKYLFFSMLIALSVLTSCQNNDDIIDDMANVTQSAALQNALNNLDLIINEDGSLIENENPTGNIIIDFCFDFVYPINLVYNTGTTVEVNSFEELIEVLINSTQELFIVGIEFPFQVEVFNQDNDEIEIITINNEEEFLALIESCGFEDDCICPDVVDPVCVEITTPNGETILISFGNPCLAECEGFTEEDFVDCGDTSCEDECPQEEDPVCVEIITPNGGTDIITFLNACYAECEGYTEEDFIDCDISCEDECPDEYDPVCVEAQGMIIEFDNFCLAQCEGYTQEDLVDCEVSCEDECPDVYDPVCVLTNNGDIEEYDNFCLAMCDGYDQGDLVDCENDGCEVGEINVLVGECNDDGTYSITIDFEHENAGNEYFDLYVRNNELIGYYLLSELPLTIESFEMSGFDNDYIKVCINDNPNCCNEAEWVPPSCGNSCEDNCPQVEDPVCVEFESPTGEIIIITYLNACYAECDGYTQEDFVDCDPSPDCYEYGFPIQMYLNGATVNVDNNEQVDDYLDQGYDLVYPIELIINNEIILVYQGILEGAYGPRCD